MELYIFCVILGIFAGVFAGMGMGGGTFLIPLLIIFLSFSQISAQSINLVAFIPMSIVALIIHLKNKLVNFKIAFKIIAVALVGCFGGVLLLQVISSDYLTLFYSIFLIIVGVWLLYEAWKKRK